MKIIFIMVTKFNINALGNIYIDLIKELKSKGNEIYVVSANEKRFNLETNYEKRSGINILSVRTGNIQKTKALEKGISTLLIEKQYKNAIRKYFNNVKFDLIIYATPPITFTNLIKYLKNKYKAKTYLLLKDIFPQNALDIGILNNKGIIYNYFRKREKALYKISDYIGCMSEKNKQYLINNNSYLDINRVEVCPNSINIKDKEYREDKSKLRNRFNIEADKFVMIYGGNLGKPQGIDFLLDVIQADKNNRKIFTLIIGNGTEFKKIKDYIEGNEIKNVRLISELKKEVYDRFVMLSDVGLILLDKRFTIPNFPSRLLTYMEYELPIIASTDKNTDIRECIRSGGFGEWCESGDIKAFNKIINKMMYDKELLNTMGKNSRKSLERNFNVKQSANRILNHFNNM